MMDVFEGLYPRGRTLTGAGGKCEEEETAERSCCAQSAIPPILHPPVPFSVGRSRRVRRIRKKILKLNLGRRSVVDRKVLWFCLSFSLPYFSSFFSLMSNKWNQSFPSQDCFACDSDCKGFPYLYPWAFSHFLLLSCWGGRVSKQLGRCLAASQGQLFSCSYDIPLITEIFCK